LAADERRDRVANVITPAPRDSWEAIVLESDEATAFHTPEWLEVCCSVGGYRDASRLFETVDGRQLVLPLVTRDGHRLGRGIAWSMPPNWGFGGVITRGRVTSGDIETVIADVNDAGVRTIVKPGPLTAVAWANASASVRVRHTVHVVDLAAGWWEHLSTGTRYKIRRAEREGVTIKWDTTGGLVPIAWDLYLRWATNRGKKHGLPPAAAIAAAESRESLAQFAAVARVLGDRCRVGVASIAERPVGFMILLINGIHAHYWRGASDETLTRGRYPNQLLLARLIEEAAAAGCRWVHLGESGGVRTLETFKESLGGERRSYDELRFESRAATVATNVHTSAAHLFRTAGSRFRRARMRMFA
jgi:hypothetical protein